MLAETPEQVKPPANILAVAAAPASVAEYECQFGGKRLVEATLFYDADGKLQPPQPNVLVVEELSFIAPTPRRVFRIASARRSS